MLDYEYDACGRITKVTETRNGTATVTEYTYDALGQLLTEKVNGTVVNAMTYDSYGNILTKNGVAYSYDSTWKDRLVSVGNKTITYGSDPCNPATYFGNSLVWEKGRQLKQFGNYTYKYNANGIRTRKTVNNINHFYFLDGTKILREKWGEDDIVPIYDTNESVIGLTRSTESGTNTYYFLKNLQGDIIAITDASGTVIARYKYDAWGKVLSVTDANGNSITSPFDIANVNPFRYRGYYYDTETGLYYLQSRYYDPTTGRFINADEAYLVGMNMEAGNQCAFNLFVYCCNQVVMLTDITGNIALEMIIGAIYGAFLGLVGYLLDISLDFILKVLDKREKFSNYVKHIEKNIVWWKLLASVILGAACGALATTNKFKLVSTITNLLCSVYSAATSGTGILFSILIGIITFILQEAMKSARSFSRFNFKKVNSQASKTFKRMSPTKIAEFTKTVINSITYYLKSNAKLFKQCFGEFTRYTLAQWGVIFGFKIVA